MQPYDNNIHNYSNKHSQTVKIQLLRSEGDEGVLLGEVCLLICVYMLALTPVDFRCWPS